MTSGGTIYIPSFIKIGSGVQKLLSGRDLIRLFSFIIREVG
jgi:hypothetical protein